MKITILTYGSRGDVQPYLALAVGLQMAGHQVKLAAPHRFEAFVNSYNVPLAPLAGNPEIISERLNNAGANPIRMIRAISDYLFIVAEQVARQAFAACDNAELIIHSFLFTTGGHSFARARGIPDISVQTFPIFAPTREIAHPAIPGAPPGWIGYFFHWLFTQIFWHGGNFGYKRVQKAVPEIFNMKLHWPFTSDKKRIMTPLLFAFSPTVIPRPDDWNSPHIHIPGYFFLDTPDDYHPPAELTDFLSAGNPPVCVTFGSMVNREAEHIYRVILSALEKTESRAIILSGWGDLENISLPESVLLIDSAPHDWLLPRCKTVIHHGGAGTTAAGLRAGIPNIVVAFAADQPFWGARVYAIGAGPRHISVKKLTTERIVTALVRANENAIRNTAQAVGEKIRGEDGVGQTVRFIQEYVGERDDSTRSPIF